MCAGARGRSGELFTLFQLPGVADAKFDDDARTVTQDLQTLKKVLERGH